MYYSCYSHKIDTLYSNVRDYSYLLCRMSGLGEEVAENGPGVYCAKVLMCVENYVVKDV